MSTANKNLDELRHRISAIETNTNLSDNYGTLISCIPAFRDRLISKYARYSDVLLEYCVEIVNSIYVNDIELQAYIVAMEFDSANAPLNHTPNIVVTLVIIDTANVAMSEFTLTTFTKATNTPDGTLDETRQGVADTDGKEIFSHYPNIREAAIQVIKAMALDETNARFQETMAACWLLAGIKENVYYDHSSKINFDAFLSELK